MIEIDKVLLMYVGAVSSDPMYRFQIAIDKPANWIDSGQLVEDLDEKLATLVTLLWYCRWSRGRGRLTKCRSHTW